MFVWKQDFDWLSVFFFFLWITDFGYLYYIIYESKIIFFLSKFKNWQKKKKHLAGVLFIPYRLNGLGKTSKTSLSNDLFGLFNSILVRVIREDKWYLTKDNVDKIN
jgi:hypothetical protein